MANKTWIYNAYLAQNELFDRMDIQNSENTIDEKPIVEQNKPEVIEEKPQIQKNQKLPMYFKTISMAVV